MTGYHSELFQEQSDDIHMQGTWYRALGSRLEDLAEGDLAFREDEAILITDQSDQNWWIGYFEICFLRIYLIML